MNRVFRTVNGDAVPDVVNHTLGVLKECPWVEVHIGTDSQNHRRSTVYVTVIAYRYGNRGVHYILHKQKVKKIKDKWTRLWNEADYSIEVAEWLTQKVKVKVEIDLDFNSLPHGSPRKGMPTLHKGHSHLPKYIIGYIFISLKPV